MGRAVGNKENTFEKKTVGIVDVKLGEKLAKLTLLDGKKFKNGETSIKLPIASLPKRPKVLDGKQYRIRMNEDEDGVESIGPATGVHRAKFTGLGKRGKDELEPKPYIKTFAAGTEKENSHLEFFAQYEITQGAFRGVDQLAIYLHYKFEDDGEGFTRWDTVDTPQASQLHKLQGWGDVHKVWEDNIPWDTEKFDVDTKVIEHYAKNHNCDFSNILPILEERALEADVEVDLVFEKGYIKSVQAVESYEEDEDDLSDVTKIEIKEPKKVNDKPAVKKVSKKKVEDTDDDL